MLSIEMQDRITHHVTAAIARRKLSGGQHDVVHAIIAGCLMEADDDDRAANLLALAEDRLLRGAESAISCVLSGRINLVALLDETGKL